MLNVLVAMVLVGIISVGLTQLLSGGFKAQRRISSRVDVGLIKQSLYNYVDCLGTFAAAGIDPNNPNQKCNSNSSPGGQVPPYLRLRRKTLGGAGQWFTGELDKKDGFAFLGGHAIRVTCSGGEQTLIVRVGEMKNGELDFDHPRALLFGMDGNAIPLCY